MATQVLSQPAPSIDASSTAPQSVVVLSPTQGHATSNNTLLGAESDYINSLLYSRRWAINPGDTSVSLTYSFTSLANSVYVGDYNQNLPNQGRKELTESQKQGVRDALALWSNIANIQFTEIEDSNSAAGDLRFGVVSTSVTDTAFAFLPTTRPEGGDVWIGDTVANANIAVGNYAFFTLLHEIGHALGLKHLHETTGNLGPVADPSIDALLYSVMSYRDYVGDDLSGYGTQTFPRMPGLHDVAAIQYLYGANMDFHAGDDVYLDDASERVFPQTLWDAGGTDTLDWSGQSSAVEINLNPGSFSKIGPGYETSPGEPSDPFETRTFAIAYNAWIENANGGSGDDTLIGNDLDNTLSGGLGSDSINGGAGTDMLREVFDGDMSLSAVTLNMVSGVSVGLDTLTSMETAYLSGGASANSISASAFSGNVKLEGRQGSDSLTGGAFDDTLIAGLANDTVTPGTGVDHMSGGAGNDTYEVDTTDDVLTENADAGIDTVFSPVTWTLGANFEDLVLTGNANINGTGNALSNGIFGNSGANQLLGGEGADTLDGDAGNDTMEGGLGNDSYTVDAVGDVVTESSSLSTEIDTVESTVTYTLPANVENLVLFGGAAINGSGNTLANHITGNNAANRLNGWGGADTMLGGLGNDVYIVNDLGDVVTESSNLVSEIDRVESSVSYTLSANVEQLVLSGATAINGNGNTLGNRLTGNGAANVLNGGSGNDTMVGGLGNDTYIVDSVTDIVSETSALLTEIDRVESSVTYTLPANVEQLLLTGAAAINGNGNSLGNELTGNAAANRLNGGVGNDTMLGGLGNDVYIVDAVGDSVVETSAILSEIDRVESSVTYTLSANVEQLVLTGGLAINGTGNGLGNRLTGNGAANVLDGGSGKDTMIGGLGNDIYIVDSSTDVVSETSALVSEIDRVDSSVTYSLSANVEQLVLTGASAINGNGNALGNRLTGNAAANRLNGGVGIDTMIGGLGNDVYVVDSSADVITESNTSTLEIDRVESTVSYTLPSNVEVLVLAGAAGSNATGNTLNNQLSGNGAANSLRGETGRDSLSGGAENDTLMGASDTLGLGVGEVDTLTGGAGADVFVLGVTSGRFYDNGLPASPGQADYALITDFGDGADRLQLRGSASPIAYFLGASPVPSAPGSALYHDSNANGVFNAATDEMIAVIQGTGATNALLNPIYV